MTGLAEAQTSLEGVLKDEIVRVYQEVADKPESAFRFSMAGQRRSCSAMHPNGSTAHRSVPSHPSQE